MPQAGNQRMMLLVGGADVDDHCARPKRTARRTRAVRGQRMRQLWAQAEVASQSARRLCEHGDGNGSMNRAYYAMFGAARAALASVRASLAQSKKHGTILRRFDRHLVQDRGFPAQLGRSFLGRQMSNRHLADYGEVLLDAAAARGMVGDMDRFLAEIGPLVRAAKR
jgi:uncharacterized protein (UPF0332 family)